VIANNIKHRNIAVIVTAALILSFPSWGADQPKTPDTLEEAYQALNALLRKEDIDEIRSGTEDDAVFKTHFGLGMWIRNNWFRHGNGLLFKVISDKGFRTFDSMSSALMMAYWCHLNGKAAELSALGEADKKLYATPEAQRTRPTEKISACP